MEMKSKIFRDQEAGDRQKFPFSAEPVQVADAIIPFCQMYLTGNEQYYVGEAISSQNISGPGTYTRRCEKIMRDTHKSAAAFLVPSCSAALEMSALLLELGPGDEVIMPSFTFVSTANAVVLRGATPVFVDVDATTFNIDPRRIRDAITARTKAIFVVHYAGVPADMKRIMHIAREHGLQVVEDAAQAYGSTQDSRPVGASAPLACFSFHGTKNISAGEAGALLINTPDLLERADILREKGTNRNRFLSGKVDFYNWQDVGSSQIVSDLTAAFLLAQLESASKINACRVRIWNAYLSGLASLQVAGKLHLPDPPKNAQHNGHIFFVVLASQSLRHELAAHLKMRGIQTATHYVPLHSSPGGRKFARSAGPMTQTDRAASCLLRLPLYSDMEQSQDRIISAMHEWAGMY